MLMQLKQVSVLLKQNLVLVLGSTPESADKTP